MIKTINYISINDSFWIQIKSDLITFGYKGLPNGVHFTFVYDSNSPDLNFHVTKNSSESNNINKPKIKIVVIDKKDFEDILPSLTLSILNKILIPIDIKHLNEKSKYGLGFLSYDNLEKLELYSFIERMFLESFDDISRLKRKTRLKIEGNIEKQLDNFVSSDVMKKLLFENIVDLSFEFEKKVDFGMVLSEDLVLQVLRINNCWYKIKTDIVPLDLLTAILTPQLVKHLVLKTKRAIVAVKNSKTYSDTECLNKPIRLTINTQL